MQPNPDPADWPGQRLVGHGRGSALVELLVPPEKGVACGDVAPVLNAGWQVTLPLHATDLSTVPPCLKRSLQPPNSETKKWWFISCREKSEGEFTK